MKKFLKRTLIVFASITILIFLSSLSFVLILQTQWGEEKAKSALIEIARKNHVVLKIKELKGSLPFTLVLSSVEIEYGQEEIKIEKLSTDFSILALFRKELSFPNLKAKNIFVSSKEKTPSPALSGNLDSLSLPLNISLPNFNLKNIHISGQVFSLKGNLEALKKLRSVNWNFTFTKNGFKKDYLKFIGSKENEAVSLTLKANVSSLKFFVGLLLKEMYSNLDMLTFTINSKTTWNELKNFLLNDAKKPSSIKGEALGYLLPHIKFDPFEPFNFIFDFELDSNFAIKIPRIFVKNEALKIEGSAIFGPKASLQNCFFTFKSDLSKLKNLPLKGNMSGKLLYIDNEATLTYLGSLEIEKHPINNIEGSIVIKKNENQNFQGKLSSSLDFYNERLSLSSDLLLNSDLKLSNLLFNSPSLNGNGDLSISKDLLFEGFCRANFNNLSLFEYLFHFKMNGTLQSEINFSKDSQKQMAAIQLKASNFYFKDLLGDSLLLKMNIKDLFQKPSADLNLSLNNARLHKIKIDTLSFSTSSEEKHPFDLSLAGSWRTPLELKSSGFWSIDDNFLIKIQNLSGLLLQSSFSLVNPVDLIYGKEFSLKNVEIKMPKGHLKADLLFSKIRKDVEIDAKNFPLDFLSFNPLEVNVEGFGSLLASFHQNENKTQGHLNFLIDEMNLNSISEEYILKTHGNIEANIENEKLLAKLEFFKENDQLVNLTSSLPLKIMPYPLKLDIDQNAPIKGDLALKIKIEDILDFFDLGNHHLEGDIDCNLSLSGMLAKPHIDGSCTLQKGSYENYYSGTALSDINIELGASDGSILLKSLKAGDGKKGNLEAYGSIDLSSANNYFFSLDLSLKEMQLVDTDLVTASFEGGLKIEGDKNQALAKGDLKVSNADFMVPDKLPQTMPDLNVKFINKSIAVKEPEHHVYPLNLDINISSSDHIFVKGKGVDAELKGGIVLKGSYYDLIPEGKLELVKGTYLFSGRNFSLSEGTIVFPGKAKVMPRLSIKADLPQEGYLISASLQGPINAPHLSFTSTPTLPLSSIISIILFGKDLSGISGLQAMQLATTIAAISDTSSLLESTKRSLGIDRLTVVSKTGEKSEEQVSVEVGKYITRDLLISIKQGITEGTSNASVELNVGWGFILQLETLQEEEQSRGTLKWSRNF